MVKVLYVDDEEQTRKAFCRLLKHVPNVDDVVLAGSGEEALGLLKKSSYDGYGLILTDYEMPGMNGISFLNALQQYEETHQQGRFPPRVIISGRMDRTICQNAIKAGAEGGLEKFATDIIKAVATELIAQGISPTLSTYLIENNFLLSAPPGPEY